MTPPTTKRQALVDRLADAVGCHHVDARSYLEQCGWDYERALELARFRRPIGGRT